MKLTDLLGDLQESQEEWLNRCIVTSHRKDWGSAGTVFLFTDKTKEKLEKVMTFEDAQDIVLFLRSRPEKGTCKFYKEGKLCDHCGGGDSPCQGIVKDAEKK